MDRSDMADLGPQQGRNYKPNPYGHTSSFQRDAAFSEIFGGAPPPGRSQTMTSQTPQFLHERAHTMTSNVRPPMAQRGPAPPIRYSQNGYGTGPVNGYMPPNGLTS